MSELIPTVTIPVQSHSSLETFHTCPRQYEAKHVLRSVKFQPTYESRWGDDAHNALENFLNSRGADRIPDVTNALTKQNMRDYEALGRVILDRADRKGGKVLAERKFAITHERTSGKYFDVNNWVRGKIDVTVIYPELRLAEVLDFKGLAVSTPLPTPTGWTTMGQVVVGDTLLDRAGNPCKVVGKSQVKNIKCYEIVFDDTSRVTCDKEHLWVLKSGEVVGVQELKRGDYIPLASPVDLPAADLPIDPYLFGWWLADGKHTSGEITKPDDFMWDEVVRRGYEVSHDYAAKAGNGKCQVRTVYGIRGALNALGVIGNKRIPDLYLRASIEQRLDLLRGIMDGDGTANHTRKQAVFTSVDSTLAYQVFELAVSLGQRPKVHTVTARGFGKVTTAYHVAFSPMGLNPFLLPRKADKMAAAMAVAKPRDYRRVVSVEKVKSVPTQCVAVDSPDHTFLCTSWFIPTHNTGKRKSDPDQLMMYSASALVDYPGIDVVRGAYIWLKEPVNKAIDKPIEFSRYGLDTIWASINSKYYNVVRAWQTNTFPPKPSGLCGWCDVTTCEFWKESPEKLRRQKLTEGL